MADPSVRNIASATGGGPGLTVNKPTGTADGDGLIATFVTAAPAGTHRTVNTLAGWTAQGTPWAITTDDGYGVCKHTFKKEASGEGASYAFTFSGTAETCAGTIVAIQNRKAGSSWIGANTQNSGDSQTTTFTGFTAIAGSLVIVTAHDWGWTGTLTPPTGFAEQYDASMYVASKAGLSAGATGNFTMTNGNGVSTDFFLADVIEALTEPVVVTKINLLRQTIAPRPIVANRVTLLMPGSAGSDLKMPPYRPGRR